MDNQARRAALDWHWNATVALDSARAHEIYHNDVIVGFSWTSERILR